MKIVKLNPNVHVTIDGFLVAFRSGMEKMLEAAMILAALVEKDPQTFKKIRQKEPNASYNLLGNLERVGRGQMRLELLYDDSPAARRLADCTFEVQNQAYEAPQPIVNVKDGKMVRELKPIQELSPSEAAFLIVDGHIRSEDEQTAILKSKIVVGKFNRAQRYDIAEDGTVTFLEKTKLEPNVLEEILQKAKDKSLRFLEKSMKRNQAK